MTSYDVTAETLEARFEKVRTFLEDLDLGALLAYSPPQEHKWGQTGHVSYLSGWANHDRIVDSAVVVPVSGRPALLIGADEYTIELASHASPLEDMRLVRPVESQAFALVQPGSVPPPNSNRSFAAETLAILQESGNSQEGVGVVGLDNMPLPLYESLSEELGEQLRRVDGIVAELRSIKSDEELELMRHAARLNDLGFETMLEVARPGVRGNEIVAEMERAMRREGADHSTWWFGSGPPPDWDNVSPELQPHLRVLEEGDLMEACSYVVYKGYWCHAARVGTLVRPLKELDEQHAIVRASSDAGIANMRPGLPVSGIARAMSDQLAEYGVQHEEDGRVGHGIGLDYGELPVPNGFNESLLQSGMTIAIHANRPSPDPRKAGMTLSDVCVVTPEGPEILTKFPREPFVAG